MAVKFVINKNCVGCGLCTSEYPDFFQEKSDGKAQAIAGKVINNKEQAEKTAAACPASAIEVQAVTESTKQTLQKLINKLKNFEGCPVPTAKDIPFNKNDYQVDIPSASGQHRYVYSSDSEAEWAALREFERCMYSQIDSIILKIITQYRVRMIKPYYTKDINDGSVYAKTNAQAEKILKEIKNVVGAEKLPADFDKISLFPDHGFPRTTWKMLNKGELVSDELISAVKSEFDYTADRYDCYWDTDDMETYAGTNWRGEPKYKDKYCYRSLNRAFSELGKDLIDACHYADDRIIEHALGQIQELVKDYNKELKALLNQKANMIKQFC